MLLLGRKGPLGKSFAVVVCCSLAANLLSNAVTGSGEYWETHAWPLALALLTAGLVIWWYSGLVERRTQPLPAPDGTPPDGTPKALRWCGAAAAVIGLYVLIANKTPGPSPYKADGAPRTSNIRK